MKTSQRAIQSSRHRAAAVRRLAILLCGIALGVVLLVIVYSIDTDSRNDDRRQIETLHANVPEVGRPGELENARTVPGEGETRIGPVERGQVEVADPKTGRLAQRYRFDRLDPNPEGFGPGWIRLTKPILDIFGSNDQIIRLRGDSAVAYQPNSAIESGSLDGNVIIECFPDQRAAATDRPEIIIRTTNAQLDNILGEIRAEDSIHVETISGEFLGRDMQMFLNDEEGIIQRLTVTDVDFIRLADQRPAHASPRDESVAMTSEPSPRKKSDATDDLAPKPAKPRPSKSNRDRSGSEIGSIDERDRTDDVQTQDASQFYRLTLTENVVITQGVSGSKRIVRGDELAMIFSLEGSALSLSRNGDPHRPFNDSSFTAGTLPIFRELMVYGLVLGQIDDERRLTIAPPKSSSDTIITCSGPLVMTPIRDRREWLASADDVRMELHGSPVTLDDEAAQSHATCDLLVYDVREDRVELMRDESRLVTMTSPELEAQGERFWLQRSDQRGGFTGPGRASFTARSSDGQSADSREVQIEWGNEVGLVFETDVDPEGMGDLKSAHFLGDVVVLGSQLDLPNDGEREQRRASTAPDSLRCDALTVELEARTIRSLHANGDVEASDELQTLWADRLDAEFSASSDGPDGETVLSQLHAFGDVQLRLDHGQRIFAETLDVNGIERTAVLSGADVRLIDGPNVIDRATRILIHEEKGSYELVGPGRFRRFDRPIFDAERDRLKPQLLDHIEGRNEDLRIVWDDGVTITSAAADLEDAQKESGVAHFQGNVQIISPDVKLHHADEMFVHFIRGEEGRQEIQRVVATGNVRARSLTDDGTLSCRELTILMTRNDAGRTRADQLTAEGNVVIASESQMLWADSLVATFRDVPADEAPANRDADVAVAGEIDQVEAFGNLQILLEDGQRVFADRLIAHPKTDEAQVLGDRVRVIGSDFVLDGCRHLKLNRTTGQYSVEGPGSFIAFDDAVPLSREVRPSAIVSPDDDRRTTLVASWTQSALYLENKDAAETLELRGEVRATADPDPLEHNEIEADVLTLDFLRSKQDAAQSLVHLTARGDARMESRTWRTPDRVEQPRVFYVAGQHIDYDVPTQEAYVIGDGELLVRDEWPSASGASSDDAHAGKGTSFFKWRKELHMTRVLEGDLDVYDVVMTGDVECLRQGIDGRTAQFWGQMLRVEMDRPAASNHDQASSAGTLELGGSMTTRRIRGQGGISIRTPERQVACDRFDYNPKSDIAEVNAAPGRMVSILTTGSGRPMRARNALWNMDTGTITITAGVGSQ